MIKKPFALIFTGPTGVGKTSLVDAVTNAIPSEIINIDMGQFYAPLSIGTAKPNWKEAPVAHHLFDVITEPRDFTVAQYRDRVQAVIHDVWNRKKIPILVGGSGFYVKSLFFAPSEELSLIDSQVADGSIKKYAHIPQEQRWEHLYSIDPIRADVVAKKDYYRIERALDIWYATGKKPSTFTPKFDPLCSFFLTCLTRDREQLYNRIDKRVHTMIDEGWISEVEQLIGTPWEPYLMRKKLIGYMEIFEHLHNPANQKQLISVIQQKTRNYAKRQMTFWRSLKRAVHKAIKEQPVEGVINSKTDEVNLTLTSPDVYIKRLLVELQPILKEL